jgi:predicted small metal-binding protein
MTLESPEGATPAQKTTLSCPCGEWIKGKDEDELVANARAHLAAEHPDLDYTREEILFMAF